MVSLTHAHQDHVGGLLAILENLQVGRVWIGREVSSRALLRLEELAREQKIPIEHELRGKTIHWDGVEGDFLWPEIAPGEVAPSATNNDSLVVHLQFGSRSILLPGNAEKQAEREILSENSAKAMLSEVLKIVHYGSKNSTTTEFLAAVRPRFGIISAGEDNPYEHPSPELLERLENAGLRVLRSDRDGAVHVDKWHAAGNHLLRCLPSYDKSGSVSAWGSATSAAKRKEGIRNLRRPAIRGSFCTAPRRTNRWSRQGVLRRSGVE